MDTKSCHIGPIIKELGNLIRRKTFGITKNDEPYKPTMMQGWIIGYLCRNKDKEIFQKDIEQNFEIRRSTATNILQLMEKNGFIKREAVDYDARLKKICITPKAVALNDEIMEKIKATEKIILKGISKDELDIFLSVVEKMKTNLRDSL